MIEPALYAVSGIVLAGGRSRRFGSDKLAVRIGDGTLLDRSVAAVAQIATDIVVVVAPGDHRVPSKYQPSVAPLPPATYTFSSVGS